MALTPIQRDTLRKQAQATVTPVVQAGSDNLSRALRYKLSADRSRLKKIMSMQAKAELKRELLPEYAPYVDGLLAAQSIDSLITQVMIWAFDTADYERFDHLARYALTHKVPMPDGFERSTAAWLAESVAKVMLVEDKPTTLQPLLFWLEEWTRAYDMHDEVRAKLHRACAETLETTEPQKALEHYERALRFDTHTRVKKKIKALKDILATQTESPSSQGQAAHRVESGATLLIKSDSDPVTLALSTEAE